MWNKLKKTKGERHLANNAPIKPVNLVYGVDDRPPILITLILALQHVRETRGTFLFRETRGTFLFCHEYDKIKKEVMEWEDRQER